MQFFSMRLTLIILSILLAKILIPTLHAYDTTLKRNPISNEMILALTDDAEMFLKSVDEGIEKKLIHQSKNQKIYKLSFPLIALSDKFVADFEGQAGILWAAPNYIYTGEGRESFTPNDPEMNKQIHHRIIHSREAFEKIKEGEEIIIAVTDDGFKLTHEDLRNIWARNKNEIPNNKIDDDGNGYVDDDLGWNFNENNNNVSSSYDFGAHGTHVAGIIGAQFDNAKGGTGLSPHIRVMPLKFYGDESWTSEMILRAYLYAVDNGARIISTSYMIDAFVDDRAYLEALNYADERGVLVFNSAGNSGILNPPRAQLKNVILVASTQSGSQSRQWDKKSTFSNYGAGIDLSAPGDPIYSTAKSGSYVRQSGTSMAAPVAAATAAVIWSLHPNFSRDQVVTKLFTSLANIDEKNQSFIGGLGSGRVDLKLAVESQATPINLEKIEIDRDKREVKLYLRGMIKIQSISEAISLDGVPVGAKARQLSGSDYLALDISSFAKGSYLLSIDGNSLQDIFENPVLVQKGRQGENKLEIQVEL